MQSIYRLPNQEYWTTKLANVNGRLPLASYDHETLKEALAAADIEKNLLEGGAWKYAYSVALFRHLGEHGEISQTISRPSALPEGIWTLTTEEMGINEPSGYEQLTSLRAALSRADDIKREMETEEWRKMREDWEKRGGER